jgi:hypothetical protein
MTTKPKPRKAPAAETVEPTAIPDEESRVAERLEREDKLIDAIDTLGFAKAYIHCIHMAAASVSPHQRMPISAVADMASDKIQEAISLLEECRAHAKE